MRKVKLLMFGLAVAMPLSAVASNIIRTPAPINVSEDAEIPTKDEKWVAASPLYGDWINQGEVYNCSPWLPAADTAEMTITLTQTATCNQRQVREVQAREQLEGTQNYRNVGAAYEESQVTYIDKQRDVRGSVARSCFIYKEYGGATRNGIYTIKIDARNVSVMCDMVGGGWTVVGVGYQGAAGNWAATRDAINPGVVPDVGSQLTARLSDYDINAIPKTAYKVVTTGYNNTRYFKGGCQYNSIAVASGDCSISYATEQWTSPRGNGQSGEGAGGLSDHRASVSSDGLYVTTSARINITSGWWAGNGTTTTNTGSAIAGTRVSQYIYVK